MWSQTLVVGSFCALVLVDDGCCCCCCCCCVLLAAKVLIQNMMCIETTERFTARRILDDVWFTVNNAVSYNLIAAAVVVVVTFLI